MVIMSNATGSTAAFELAGKMTVHASRELAAAVDALPRTVCDVEIDLDGVDYVSSAGLRVLVAASKLAAQRGGRLRLRHLQPSVHEVFDLTGLANVLDIAR